MLINALLAYLKENIDDEVSIRVQGGKHEFPLNILELYDLYHMKILDKNCILIGIINKAPSLDEIKKHIKVIGKNYDGPIVLSFKTITTFRRKSLIDNRIPFVVSDGQIYLPFLGLDLKKITKEHIETIEKFTNSTQLVYLYLLYNKDLQMNANELAKILNISHMTALRALNELYMLNLMIYETGGKTGRTKTFKRINDPDYYLRGKDYLRNPLSKTVYVEKMAIPSLIAGLEALSTISMINPPKRSIRAISKQNAKIINKYIVNNRDKIADQNLVEVQIWNYDPEILSGNDIVDILSLALTLSEFNDERVDSELEERLNGEQWYMD